MNAHSEIRTVTRVNMTSKGQVLIPKEVREALGLVPGQPVCVGRNDRGEAVIFADRQLETHEERAARIRAAIDDIAGKYFDGSQTTDEIMFELRGDRRP